jgi:POT family proton-dependent oligopeptide transporter
MQNPRSDKLPDDRAAVLPGALGLGQSTATNISNAFFLVSFLTPMLFAVISDSWLGRYRTLMLGLVCYFLGCLILVATSIPSSLDSGAGVPGLSVSMVFVALGAGSIKACYAPFLGDQMAKGSERVERRRGKFVVVSKDRTLQFAYNAYYWYVCFTSSDF